MIEGHLRIMIYIVVVHVIFYVAILWFPFCSLAHPDSLNLSLPDLVSLAALHCPLLAPYLLGLPTPPPGQRPLW